MLQNDDKRVSVDDPLEALRISQAQKVEADSLSDRVDRLLASLRSIQKENGFAPRMRLAYSRNGK